MLENREGIKCMSDIIKVQHGLARKAQSDTNHQFGHLYRIICNKEWINEALENVLQNKGSKTAGIDGVTKKTLKSDEARMVLIQELETELREKRFKPSPVKRIYIPKVNDKNKKRPLGIPVVKDRVVQMLIKMVLEPIWESSFMNCSNGFRPKRRTMDCIALLDSYINKKSKFYWVIEGDIKGAFDNIHHETLMDILCKRIEDQKLLNLIRQFLKAGVMENKLFHKSESGSPQGGICSPLLANIYLHEMDKYWWEHYGGLHRKVKEKRRIEKKGNCAFIKYADDWLLLTNGTKQEAYRLRDEFEKFLKEKLHLELSVDKTHVTHVNNGFDFLGFNIRRYVRSNDKPKMFVQPTSKSIEKLKTKIKEMTGRKAFKDAPLLKFTALNSLLSGWISYYRHSNVKTIAKQLDFWVNDRLVSWLKKRHRLPVRRILKMYKKRQNGTRYNLGIADGDRIKYLYKMFDQPITKYKSRKPGNPYLNKEPIMEAVTMPEAPMLDYVWLGNADNEIWRVIKAEVKAERGARCELCGSRANLDLHHIKAKKRGGADSKENAQLLCESCHIKTPTYGRQKK